MILSILTYILQNLPSIILLITTIIALINAIKSKRKLTDKEVLHYINETVTQAEMLYNAGNGDVKLEYVKTLVLKKYPKISHEQLTAGIDAAVKLFNDFKNDGKINNQ